MMRHWKLILGTAVSGLLLWWALRDVSAAEVMRELRRADPWLFLASVVAATLAFPIRALRWRSLLLPAAGPVPFRPRFAATSMGFAANNLLPARIGEFVRAYSLHRMAPISTSAALGSLVVERIFDGLVLVAFLFASMAAPSFPAGEVGGIDPRAAATVVAVAMAGVGVLLFVLVTAPVRSVAFVEELAARFLPHRMRRPLVEALRAFLEGVAVLRDGRLFLISLAWAVAQWAFLAGSYLLALRAFGIDQVPFAGAVFLQSLIALAVAIPSSPGFFGPFEAAAKLGLALWEIPPEQAVSFAVGFHLGGFVPVTLIGLYYAWRVNLRWSEVGVASGVVEPEPTHAVPASRRG